MRTSDAPPTGSNNRSPSVGAALLKRKILVPPKHLFPPDEWRIIEVQWSPGYFARAETAFAVSNG